MHTYWIFWMKKKFTTWTIVSQSWPCPKNFFHPEIVERAKHTSWAVSILRKTPDNIFGCPFSACNSIGNCQNGDAAKESQEDHESHTNAEDHKEDIKSKKNNCQPAINSSNKQNQDSCMFVTLHQPRKRTETQLCMAITKYIAESNWWYFKRVPKRFGFNSSHSNMTGRM